MNSTKCINHTASHLSGRSRHRIEQHGFQPGRWADHREWITNLLRNVERSFLKRINCVKTSIPYQTFSDATSWNTSEPKTSDEPLLSPWASVAPLVAFWPFWPSWQTSGQSRCSAIWQCQRRLRLWVLVTAFGWVLCLCGIWRLGGLGFAGFWGKVGWCIQWLLGRPEESGKWIIVRSVNIFKCNFLRWLV